MNEQMDLWSHVDAKLPKCTRKLLDGANVEEAKRVTDLTIRSRCPQKWLMVDLETGEVYSPVEEDRFINYTFKKADLGKINCLKHVLDMIQQKESLE